MKRRIIIHKMNIACTRTVVCSLHRKQPPREMKGIFDKTSKFQVTMSEVREARFLVKDMEMIDKKINTTMIYHHFGIDKERMEQYFDIVNQFEKAFYEDTVEIVEDWGA